MRSLLGFLGVMVAAGVGCGSPTLGEACGTAAPAFSQCVPQGLAELDLEGTWHLTGTLVTTTVPSPDPPITRSVSGSVTLEIDGCTLRSGSSAGSIDDTNGHARGYDAVGSHDLTICAMADGELAYQMLESWDRRARGGDSGSATTTGTLTR